MDRGDPDFDRLHLLHQAQAFFVTRATSNTHLRHVYSVPLDRGTGIICDQTVARTGTTSRKDYPKPLRCIRFKDPETSKALVFLTNNVTFPAPHRLRALQGALAVELFCKWITQHLRTTRFFGTSEHAMKSQGWIAVSIDVLAAIVKNRLNQEASRTRCHRFFSVTLHETMSLQ
jgi:hypothetical protein